MGWFREQILDNPNSLFRKVNDPLGLFREGGLLGWDLFGQDTTSEDMEAAAQQMADDSQAYADEQYKLSLEKITKTSIIIISVSILIFLFVYGVKKGYLQKAIKTAENTLNSEI